MIKSLKNTWNKIQQDPPGKRFRRQYKRRQKARESIANRILFIGLGLIFMVIGVVLLFAPGPGIFFVFVGWGLIAQESYWLAKLLDEFEVYLREWVDWGETIWQHSSRTFKVAIITGFLVIAAAALYAAYYFFFT